jgi:hypothetical protein
MPLTTPSGSDVASLADWAELLVLTQSTDGISTARLNELLLGEGSDAAEEEFDRDDADDGEVGELELGLIDEGRGEREVKIEQLLDEVTLRLSLGPSLYPFERQDERLVRRVAVGADIYILLLVISWPEASFRRQRRAYQIEAAFDHIALEALRRYLGRGARGIRFARNAHNPEDNAQRPQKFKDAIDWLRIQLMLSRGFDEPPDEELVRHWEEDANADHPPLNSYSDGGVDIVVWWRFADEKRGAPVMLAQCTVQIKWSEKTSDIPVELWKKWIDFETVPPQTALVIPFAISRTLEQWANRTITAGVIIDRLRLLELLNELPDDTLRELPDPITRQWVAAELEPLA